MPRDGAITFRDIVALLASSPFCASLAINAVAAARTELIG